MRNRWRARVILLAGMLLAVLMLVAAPAASAHAVLQSSDPAPGSVRPLGSVTSSVTLSFDEPVEAQLGAIQVIAGDGSRVDAGQVSHPGGAGRLVRVGLRRSAPGSYLVLWRVVSADSHPVHGSFSFAIGRPGPLASAASPPSARGLSSALDVVRGFGYAGLLALLGLAAYLIGCQRQAWGQRRIRYLAVAALAALAASTGLGFALQAAFDAGSGWSAVFDPTVLRALATTRLGHAAGVRLLLLAVLALLLGPRRPLGNPRLALLAGSTVAVVATFAASGHAARSLGRTGLDTVHVTAAGCWLGGLAVLLLVALPALRQRPEARPVESVPAASTAASSTAASPAASVAVLQRVPLIRPVAVPLRRFSVLAAGSATVVVGTGLAQAVQQVPAWGALTGTGYGRLLLIKVALVIAALGVASVSSALVHTRLARHSRRARALTATVAIESVLLLGAVAATSVLVSTTPATASYRPAQERTLTAGPLTLDLSAVAPAPRTLDLHLYSYRADGTLAEVQRLSAQASPPPGSGLGPVSIPFLNAGTGHFLASRLLLPRTGSWTLTFVVQTGEFDAYTCTTTVIAR